MIVVGVDGSSSAQAALRFAIHEANLRGATVRAVTAWRLPAMDYSGFAAAVPDPSIFEESSRAVLERTIAALGGETEGVTIERLVRMDQPAEALIAVAEEAELLVVGSRGHGGFVGLMLGSVSHQVALHARCPVVIVHAPEATN